MAFDVFPRNLELAMIGGDPTGGFPLTTTPLELPKNFDFRICGGTRHGQLIETAVPFPAKVLSVT
jgi:hypothetical protein